MKSKRNLLKKNPSCTAPSLVFSPLRSAERRGEKTREGVKSVVDLLERMKHGGGI
jgi:hypothetical protein